MIEGGKAYLATVDNILYAAILYDILTIQTKGLKAKSNFNYTKAELLAILSMDNLLKVRQHQCNKVSRTDYEYQSKLSSNITQTQPIMQSTDMIFQDINDMSVANRGNRNTNQMMGGDESLNVNSLRPQQLRVMFAPQTKIWSNYLNNSRQQDTNMKNNNDQ